MATLATIMQEGMEPNDDRQSSGWETASESDDDMDETDNSFEAWDVCRSFFDNHMSSTMEDNLEDMWKRFGFYFPDAEALRDPEGLLRYLVPPGYSITIV